MQAATRQMTLGLNLIANGAHKVGWRLPQADANVSLNFALWKELIQAAERAKLHFVFRADGAAVRHNAKDDEELSYSSGADTFEPLTLMGALAAVTEKIGFIVTSSTTYNEPFNLARAFASLDHISGGRMGWNIVTSQSEQEALNFNRDQHMEHGLRYQRAQEFVEVCCGLWDSWEDDAFIRDKQTGQYFDPAKLHNLDHKGQFFKVHGPLNTSRPVQGYPVLVQAGASGPGQDLAARFAELVYAAQKTRESAIAYRTSLRDNLVRVGRNPDSLQVLPGMMPVIGRSEAEAQDLYDSMQRLIHPKVGLPTLRPYYGELEGVDVDGPLPPFVEHTNAVKSSKEKITSLIGDRQLTIRQLYMELAGAGHHVLIGTAAGIADQMADWFEAGACDGFNVLPPFMPAPVHDVFDLLIPELQRRGLFQTEYRGTTLRENLGLARPPRPARRTPADIIAAE